MNAPRTSGRKTATVFDLIDALPETATHVVLARVSFSGDLELVFDAGIQLDRPTEDSRTALNALLHRTAARGWLTEGRDGMLIVTDKDGTNLGVFPLTDENVDNVASALEDLRTGQPHAA